MDRDDGVIHRDLRASLRSLARQLETMFDDHAGDSGLPEEIDQGEFVHLEFPLGDHPLLEGDIGFERGRIVVRMARLPANRRP